MTSAHSLAKIPIGSDELDDIEHYLTSTRSELLFARGVIFVEGDAEETLVPVFADSMGKNLDHLGIAVCNVAGVNFAPYVKLVSGMGLPFVAITDWDPLDGANPPLGKTRTLSIFDAHRDGLGIARLTSAERSLWDSADFATFSAAWAKAGIFLNEHTFEVAIANTPGLQAALLQVLSEQGFGARRTARIAAWRAGTLALESNQLLAMIADIGKGRLSAKLKKKVPTLLPPAYIASAINFLAARV